ncbi:single-stranded-DNA-specific exonuclease RecJ [Candidatus Endolissoclinum faulkneri L2]|uniref:Single-stranded-DNA-specific exonuclease RecJ n=1 Tax=Candidatus Endolissoclinum faulkneri L2 TaxID=1193729 RepID=K7YPK7_9PROT|nr:single-stranded-DNA-specific exonuclease RecJ [Candidatus Endolissoclinum faulkneri]AFX99437.1 single-stranded-DNA-specific exonuclease RecJ [Candidatus Endolissoclinum faulkneri L2]
MPQSNAFLGVEQSLTLRRWVLHGNGRIKNVDKIGWAIAQRFALPETVGHIIAQRGIELDAVESFLQPTLKAELPDPKRFIDMDFAVNRLVEAVLLGQVIGLFADYDVDGATSAASMAKYFRAVDASVVIYVPDRIKEGYGPNMPALQNLVMQGAAVIVCLDCGILATKTLAQAMRDGIDVIVVDHHLAGSELPPAIAVVNPNRLDEVPGFGYLAACGVTFLTIVAVNRALRDKGWFTHHVEPDLRLILDLTAMGTVCDVVPLTGLNRAFVAQGLKIMARRSNIGLAALLNIVGLDSKPTAYHLGFVLGPRINAGGRMGKADLGAKLLSTNDTIEAHQIAKILDYCNNKRKIIESRFLRNAIAQAENERNSPVLVVSGDRWHPGVIGIIASRLKDRFQLPTCVISIDDKGIGRGSGRSVPGIDLGAAIIAACRVGLLESGGGHAMAVGFTVAASRIGEFTAFLIERFALSNSCCLPLMPAELSVDAVLTPSGATIDLARAISLLAPFGIGNVEPRFVVSHAKVESSRIVGNQHIRCNLVGYDCAQVQSIAFHAMDNAIGSSLLQVHKDPLYVAGYLRLNNSCGNYKVQLVIDDVAQAV